MLRRYVVRQPSSVVVLVAFDAASLISVLVRFWVVRS